MNNKIDKSLRCLAVSSYDGLTCSQYAAPTWDKWGYGQVCYYHMDNGGSMWWERVPAGTVPNTVGGRN